MNKTYHIYTSYEINQINSNVTDQGNWKSTDFLVYVYTGDSDTGYSELRIKGFGTKLSALYYFREFIACLEEDSHSGEYSEKIIEIDNSINLIKSSLSDKDVNLEIVDFYINEISLNVCINGYWNDATMPILQQIIEELDYYLGEDSDEENSDISNSMYSTVSLRKIQETCTVLLNAPDVFNPHFINSFNYLCQDVNKFWESMD